MQRQQMCGVTPDVANLFGTMGRNVFPKLAAKEAHRRGWLDLKLGMALFKHRQVPILAKLAAIATGVTFTAILIAIEFPLETLIGAVVPLLGLALDFAFDGFEILLVPMIVTTLVMRWLAPKSVVESILA